MQIDLAPRPARHFFFLVIALLSGILAYSAGRAWLAEHWSASSQPVLWQKAARLEPGDAATWRLLGLYEQRNFQSGDPRRAISYFQRAARIDPRSAEVWMDLAGAYDAAADATAAKKAYERAAIDYPISAEVAWRYGSFLLDHGDSADAYREIRRALAVDPALATIAVSQCWQVNPDATAIVNQLLPANADVYLAALHYFLGQRLLGPALVLWNRELDLRLAIKMSDAVQLVDALIDQNQLAEGEHTWRQVLQATNWPCDRNDHNSLVFNGGFEHRLAGGGFDWQEVPQPGVTFAFDRSVVHSGTRSLRIHFEGTANLDFQNAFQYVPVQPGKHYRFKAYLRTEAISTDSGIRFLIFDPRHPVAPQVLTPDMIGTNPWTLVQTDFTSGPDTDLLEIVLRRAPSRKFDNKIAGAVWVDDVALTARPRNDSRCHTSRPF